MSEPEATVNMLENQMAMVTNVDDTSEPESRLLPVTADNLQPLKVNLPQEIIDMIAQECVDEYSIVISHGQNGIDSFAITAKPDYSNLLKVNRSFRDSAEKVARKRFNKEVILMVSEDLTHVEWRREKWWFSHKTRTVKVFGGDTDTWEGGLPYMMEMTWLHTFCWAVDCTVLTQGEEDCVVRHWGLLDVCRRYWVRGTRRQGGWKLLIWSDEDKDLHRARGTPRFADDVDDVDDVDGVDDVDDVDGVWMEETINPEDQDLLREWNDLNTRRQSNSSVWNSHLERCLDQHKEEYGEGWADMEES